MTYVFLVFLSLQANAETLQVRSSHISSYLNSTKVTFFQKKPSSYYYLQMN